MHRYDIMLDIGPIWIQNSWIGYIFITGLIGSLKSVFTYAYFCMIIVNNYGFYEYISFSFVAVVLLCKNLISWSFFASKRFKV